jgi:hypothetical protein
MSNRITLAVVLLIKYKSVEWKRNNKSENGVSIQSSTEEWIPNLQSERAIETFPSIRQWMNVESEDPYTFREWMNANNMIWFTENHKPDEDWFQSIQFDSLLSHGHHFTITFSAREFSESALAAAKNRFTNHHQWKEPYLFHEIDWTEKYEKIKMVLDQEPKIMKGVIEAPSSIWIVPIKWVEQ